MKGYFNWCLLFAFTGASFAVKAQDVTVSSKLDKPTILLGDQTVLRLSANLPANGKVTFPALTDTLSSKVQIVGMGKLDTLKDQSGRWTITQAYTITAFDSGVQTIPAFTFTANGSTLKTDPIPLQVEAVKVDTTKAIYDIKQPLAVKYSFMDWLRDNSVKVLLGLLLIIVLIGVWFYFKKRKKAEPVVVEVTPFIPPHIRALNKLTELRDKELWQHDEVKQYHSELTDIIREFLEKRYKIRAMEQTSDEIFSGLRNLAIEEADRSRLRQILMLADLVKFAKQKPLSTDNEQSMDNAIAFVGAAGAIIQSPKDTAQKDEPI
ncbi:BatD family protein [Pedobacter sp. JCM 36344]|uniref:BatD family protein n=1 Tax=Pedobacter sp. JCM 36344 TaxID=3374280 RepID=UPI00397DFBDC